MVGIIKCGLSRTVHLEYLPILHFHNLIPQINILPAGSDLEHPPIEHERSPRPEPVSLSAPTEPEVTTLHVGPKPTEAPKGRTKWDKAEKKADHALDKAEKKADHAVDEAEKKGKEYAKKAKVRRLSSIFDRL